MKKSEQTKEKILEAAIEMISTKGFYASSTKEIAEVAGVSEGSVFKYFNTKDELLTQIVCKAIRELKKTTITEAFPTIFKTNKSSIVLSIIENRMAFFKTNNALMKIIFQELMVNEVVKKMFTEEIWPQMSFYLDKAIEIDQKNGKLKEMDANAIKKIILGVLVFQGILEPSLKLEQSESDDAQILKIIANGIIK